MDKQLKHVEIENSYNITDIIEKICHRSRNDLQQLKNANILFTGASGFFGFWFLQVLIYLNEIGEFCGQLFVITRDRKSFVSNFAMFAMVEKLGWIHIIEGDIRKVRITDFKPDHLIHFASTSATETFNKAEQISKLDTLYNGTKNIIEQCGDSLKKVLFASSAAAYGYSESETKMRESAYSMVHSQNATFALCLGKLAAEFQINQYANKYNFDFNIARCFSFAGEFMPLNLHYAFGNFIRDAERGDKIIIEGDGSAVRSYMYVGDAISWFITLLARPKNEILNVGSDELVTIKELAEAIATQAGTSTVILGNSNFEGNFSRSFYAPDLTRVYQLYPELELSMNFREIIERMFDGK